MNNFLLKMFCKNFIWCKVFEYIFNKVAGCNSKYNGTKNLAYQKDKKIFDRIRYRIVLKNNISDVYSHKYMKSKINLDDNLPSRNREIYSTQKYYKKYLSNTGIWLSDLVDTLVLDLLVLWWKLKVCLFYHFFSLLMNPNRMVR